MRYSSVESGLAILCILPSSAIYLLFVVEEVSPMVEDVVDVRNLLKEIKAFPRSSHVTASQLLCFVNIAILLRLALGSR
jgi:hypothetical protein